jgi:hypothetical protein
MGVRFRRTHDIRELMDLAQDGGMSIPKSLMELDLLTPYAVEFRYDLVPWNVEIPLDRQRAWNMVRGLRVWKEETLKNG